MALEDIFASLKLTESVGEKGREKTKPGESTKESKKHESTTRRTKRSPVPKREIVKEKQKEKVEKQDRAITEAYKTLTSLSKKVPFNTGAGGISGHFRLCSLSKIFASVCDILHDTVLEKKDKKQKPFPQSFLDIGVGEGFPMFYAAQLWPSSGIDIDPLCVSFYNTLSKPQVHTRHKTDVSLRDLQSLKCFPPEITIVYSFNSAMPPKVQAHLLALVERAFRKGNLVVAVLSTKSLKRWAFLEEGHIWEKARIRAQMAGSGEIHSMSVLTLRPVKEAK